MHALGSETQRPHRSSGTNKRTEQKWLFSKFSQLQNSLHFILLEVWEQKQLALFRFWNWEWRQKKHKVSLWFSKWLRKHHTLDRWGNQTTQENDILVSTQAGRHCSRLGQRMIVNHIDHDVHCCSGKKSWSYFRVWIAPISNIQALNICADRLTPWGTVGNLPLLSP